MECQDAISDVGNKMHANDLNQYRTQLWASSIKISHKNLSHSSKKKIHLGSSSFDQRPEVDRENYERNGEAHDRDHFLNEKAQLGQASPELKRPFTSNLDRVIKLSEQRVDLRHSYIEFKELANQPLEDPIDLSLVKETVPLLKHNKLMMDANRQVNTQQTNAPSLHKGYYSLGESGQVQHQMEENGEKCY